MRGKVGYVTFLRTVTAMAISQLFFKNPSLIENFKNIDFLQL